MFNLAAILDGSRDHQTQFWKGAIQGPFHQRLFQIGPVASEELIKMWKVNGRTTDDGRSVVTTWSFGSGELKKKTMLNKQMSVMLTLNGTTQNGVIHIRKVIWKDIAIRTTF